MVETPTGGTQEAFGVLDLLVGLSPFVFLVGLLAGLLATGCVYPVARRVDAGFTPSGRFWRRQLTVPFILGGLGSLASAWIAVALADVWRVDALWWTTSRTLLVSSLLAAGAWFGLYRAETRRQRRASRYVYAAFVVAWSTITTSISVLVYAP